MSFEIQHAVIHSFTKLTQTTVVTEIVKKNVLLPTDNDAVIALVKGVNALLGKPGNVLSYGQFSDNMREGRFPSGFDAYVSQRDNENAFLGLSHVAVDELASQAEARTLSTGGHILIAEYESDGRAFFLVAMIKQRAGLVLNADYVPTNITEIDLSKVHQAARINFSRYAEVIALDPPVEDADEVPEDRTYLAFLGARADNEAVGYFVTALGCVKGIGSSRATKNVIDAVVAFFSQEAFRSHRVPARNAVTNYLHGQLSTGFDATLADIAFAAAAVVPEDREEVLDQFKVYLNSEQVKVPAVFAVHANTLNKSTRIKAETNNWSVQFERRLLGTTANSVVYFDAERRSLTFNQVDERIAAEIAAELALRN